MLKHDASYWKAFGLFYAGISMFVDFTILPLMMVGIAHSSPVGVPLLPVLSLFAVCWAIGFAPLAFIATWGMISIAIANNQLSRDEQLELLSREGWNMMLYSNLVGVTFVLLFLFRFVRAVSSPPDEGLTND